MTLQEINDKMLALENERAELKKQRQILLDEEEAKKNEAKEKRLREVKDAYKNYMKLRDAYVNDYGSKSIDYISKDIWDIIKGLR